MRTSVRSETTLKVSRFLAGTAGDRAGRQVPDGPLAALAATPTDLRSIRSLEPFVTRVLFDVVM